MDALQSWDEPLISDVKIIDADDECEGDSNPLFFAEWPGMKKGCIFSSEVISWSDFIKKSRESESGLDCS